MRIIVASSVVLIAFTATLGCGPHVSAPPPAPSSCPTMSLQVKDSSCGSGHCGGNSPVINQFPINGLHSDGCKNLQELSLDRESFRPAPQSSPRPNCSGADLTLVAEGDQLAAKGSHGKKCVGQELVGGVFSITSWAGGVPRQRLLLKIADLAMIPMAGGVESVPAYLFTTADGADAPLCRQEVGMAWRRSQPASSPAPMTEPTLADYAVIMTQGAVYGTNGQPIGDTKDGWFNIACADDALAKIRLYDMNQKLEVTDKQPRLRPAGSTNYTLEIVAYPGSETPDGQHAALNMLTANYCGTTKHYTRHGIKIGWPSKSDTSASESDQSASKSDQPASKSDQPASKSDQSTPTLPTCDSKASLEALWGKSGAVCVCSKSRLWLADTLVPSDRLPNGCENGRCKEKDFLVSAATCSQEHPPLTCSSSMPSSYPETIYWESDLEDHLLKIR